MSRAMKQDKLPYNSFDVKSIVEYAQVLVGSTLREHIDVNEIDDIHRRKGSFGNAVEYYYFKYDLNSDSNPDFAEVGMELKTTPLKKSGNGKLVAKERLVISMINYMTVVNEEFETSSFVHKASDVLLISYLYEKDKDPLDYIIEVAVRWGLPEEDMPQFKADWETVVNKVRAGRAHEISGRDTLYLEACTKSSNSSVRRKQPYSEIPAKPRAWALKGSYMTAVQQGLLANMESIKRGRGEESVPLIELVRKRFAPYIGMTKNELAARFGLVRKGIREPKSIYALITRQILGVEDEQKIAEFVKAGIKPKTMRLLRSGRPKEAVSFPTFDYFELAETDFEDSDFKGYIEQRYLFVVYREDPVQDGVYRLADTVFWQMPEEDIPEAKRCYDEMRNRVVSGHAEDSVRSSENRCCHVRPHGGDSRDTKPTPQGDMVVKKCFWLNQGYLAEELLKACR